MATFGGDRSDAVCSAELTAESYAPARYQTTADGASARIAIPSCAVGVREWENHRPAVRMLRGMCGQLRVRLSRGYVGNMNDVTEAGERASPSESASAWASASE